MPRPIDVYCGVVSVPPWPLSEPLVVELAVERGSFLIADVYTNAGLPGLRRFLRSRLRGVPVCDVAWISSDGKQDAYRADYWHWVEVALVFALKSFKEDSGRLLDWLDSLAHSERRREGIMSLRGKKTA